MYIPKKKVIYSKRFKVPFIRFEAATCPYCYSKLKKIPKRKTKCPVCSKTIYIRVNAEGEHFAVTENQKNEIDKFQEQVKHQGYFGCECVLGLMSLILNIIFIVLIIILP
jgi:hypothetical protein